MAVDDAGRPFELSPDPLLSSVCPRLEKIKLGNTEHMEAITPILCDKAIFGVNLQDVGLSELVRDYFKEMCAGEGAVRRALEQHLNA